MKSYTQDQISSVTWQLANYIQLKYRHNICSLSVWLAFNVRACVKVQHVLISEQQNWLFANYPQNGKYDCWRAPVTVWLHYGNNNKICTNCNLYKILLQEWTKTRKFDPFTQVLFHYIGSLYRLDLTWRLYLKLIKYHTKLHRTTWYTC